MSFTSKTGYPVAKNVRQVLYAPGTDNLTSIPKKELVKVISLVQEEERVKLGHELHDGVGPMLAIAKLYLQFLNSENELETFAINQVKAALVTAIENVRSISSQLVVSQRLNCNLIPLIANLTKMVGEIRLFRIQFIHSPEDMVSDINPGTKLALYRIVQEQLNNIIKHSKAKCVEIKLFRKKEILRMVISDDGVGFDTTKIADGIGLTNMETRVKNLNGSMKISSSPEKGCILDLSLPIPSGRAV